MKNTTTRETEMPKETFNQQLIQGLWKTRNKYDGSTRDWLRQCIRQARSK